jgi:hypothetical protein
MERGTLPGRSWMLRRPLRAFDSLISNFLILYHYLMLVDFMW